MGDLKAVNGTGSPDDLMTPPKPRKRKSDLFSDILHFQATDDHAIQVAISEHKSFRDLIKHLVLDQDFQTELEKTRAIFRWITARDLYCLKYENEEPGTPEEIFAKFRSHKTTYAKIFETMCRYVGLKCVVITGFAKGRTYKPGDQCRTRDCRHSWNAVSIDGDWYLIDTKWAARRSSSGGGVTSGLVLDCDDFYFLTDPDKFIYSHWSNNPEWQLLERPVIISEFEKLPHLKPQFFKCGLHTINEKRCVLETSTGSVALRIGCSEPTKFCYRFLRFGGKKIEEEERRLEKYVFQVTESRQTVFNIRIPRAGLFFFKVYAKPLNKTTKIKCHLTEVASYKVVADGSSQKVDPYPHCASTSWGPSQLLALFGLQPICQNAKYETTNGKLQIEFKKSRNIEVLSKLRYHSSVSPDALGLAEVIYIDKLKITLNLPSMGEYGLDIYCRDPDIDEKRFTHICQYLLVYTLSEGPVDDSSSSETENDSGRTTPTPDYPDEERASIESVQTSTEETQDDSINQTHEFVDFTVEERTRGYLVDSAPEDFKIVPVEQEVTENCPPTINDSSSTLFLEAVTREMLTKVDSHAVEVAKSKHVCLKDLLWDLIYSKNITDEILKARALFRWLISKKVHEMTFSNFKDDGSPEDIMNGLQRGRSSYADVFDVLCRYAGLQCKVIPGISKGLDYKPGQKSEAGLLPHWWNAVCVNNVWRLLDPCMASHPIVSTFTAAGEFHYMLDDHYFLTNPHQLVYTHFPDDPRWQLLGEQVSRDEFLNFPQLTPHFFAFGLDLLTHKNAIVISNGDVDILLNYDAAQLGLRFSFTIHFETGHEEYQGIKLNKYGMMEAKDGVASFRFRLPEQGSYVVYIYAKDESQNSSKENVFAQVCEYLIYQDGVSQKHPVPFPSCPYLSWGPRASFFSIGLATSQMAGSVATQDGKTEIRIDMQTLTQFRTRLVHHSKTETELEGYVVYKIIGKTAIFNFTSPGRGEYGLEIYAKGTNTDDKKLYHVAQYLIVCDEDIESLPLPKLPPGFLGPQPQFVELGLSTLSHHDPIIHSDTNRIEIIFRSSQDMRFTGNMVETETNEEHPDNIFIQTQGTVVTFVVNIPTVGFHMLRLHGIPAQDPSHQVPAVYNYLINCKVITKKAYPFPKQFGHWKEGCYMWEPMELHKDLGTPCVPFRVYIPKAKEVALVVDQEWTLLKSTNPGIWEGNVDIERYYGTGCRLTMVANYGGDITRYATLLEYAL